MTSLDTGSIALARYLEYDVTQSKLKGKTILELGSGVGYLGLTTSLLGAEEAVLSDRAALVPLLRSNIARNADLLGSARVVELDWSHSQLPTDIESTDFDYIVGSDLTYEHHGAQLLVQVLARLCAPPAHSASSSARAGKFYDASLNLSARLASRQA
eukprot:gene10680-biopygen10929